MDGNDDEYLPDWDFQSIYGREALAARRQVLPHRRERRGRTWRSCCEGRLGPLSAPGCRPETMTCYRREKNGSVRPPRACRH